MKIILCEKQYVIEHMSSNKVSAKDIVDSTISSWNLNSPRITTIRLTNREYIGKVNCLKLNLTTPLDSLCDHADYIFYCHSESECCLQLKDGYLQKKIKELSVGEKLLSDSIYIPGGPLEFVSFDEMKQLDAWSYDVIYDTNKSILVTSFCIDDKWPAGLSLK